MSFNLGQVNITFNTGDDDKDDDTIVVIEIRPVVNGWRGPAFVSYNGDFGGHLPDHSSRVKTLPFQPGTQVTVGSQYVLTVAIQPNGHDTWKFDCLLDINFEQDSATRHNWFPNNVLTQDNRSKDFHFTL